MPIPTGMAVTGAIGLVTRAAVPVTVSNQQATYQVADDPVELLLTRA